MHLILAFAIYIARVKGDLDPMKKTCIGDDNLYFEHRCYTLAMEETHFTAGTQFCKNLGGATRSHLAYITSSALVDQITAKWPTFYPQQSQITWNGGLRIGAAVLKKTFVYPTNTIKDLHDVVWYNYFDNFHLTDYESVFANQTYLMQVTRSDDNDNTENTCILLERSLASPEYTRVDYPCWRLSTAVLCERDNYYRSYKKIAQGKMLKFFYAAANLESFKACIDKCSTNALCLAFSYKKIDSQTHQCNLSTLKMENNQVISGVGFDIWQNE